MFHKNDILKKVSTHSKKFTFQKCSLATQDNNQSDTC
uniref:Uncharacterized protein n=1 Tax=Anguilla anguilla TaxID=7936 RepID=A0A0E9PTV4_ANGAN